MAAPRPALPSISRSAIPQVSTSICASVRRASSMSKSSAAAVSIRAWMLLDNQRIVAQLPPKVPSQRLRPTTSGRSHALRSNSRIRPVASSVSRSMVRSAFLATRREFSPSCPSSLAVNSSISLRSVSSRLRSRSVKSFALEVKCVQLSFQPPPVPGLGVQRGEVVLALARHLQPRLA